jgi:hypothetical protein
MFLGIRINFSNESKHPSISRTIPTKPLRVPASRNQRIVIKKGISRIMNTICCFSMLLFNDFRFIFKHVLIYVIHIMHLIHH